MGHDARAADGARHDRPGRGWPARPRGRRAAGRWWPRLVFPGRVAVEAARHFATTNATVLAGYIAYSALFALFPFLIFLATLGGFLGQDEAVVELVALALEPVPPEVRDVLGPPIHEILAERRPGLLTVSVVVALWAASSGVEALRVGLNEAHDVEAPRALWWRRLQSLALTLALAAALLAATVAMVAGPFIWQLLEWLLQLPRAWRLPYAALRYAVGGVVLLAMTWTLYYVLPNRPMRKRDPLPGAVAAMALWSAAASLFSWYLGHLANFTVTYGSLGGIVVSLFFFYVSAAVFLFGAEINAAIRRLRAVAAAARVAAHSGPRPPLARSGERE